MADRIIAETPYLRLIDRDGWTFVERPNASGVVTIVAITPERNLVFVEQFRKPLKSNVIEWPAGLVGDEDGQAQEDAVAAAGRELEEETGYRAGKLELVSTSVTSAGMSNELVWFVLASDLTKVGPGGGTPSENITVHEIPFAEVRTWLKKREREGVLVAAKLFTGLYFAHEAWGTLG